MKIENVLRKNRTVLLGDEKIQFDADGYAEVSDAVGAKLTALGGYHVPGKPKAQSAAITPVTPEVQDTAPDLESMNAAQLKKLAKDRGIDIGDASKKADLIEILEKAQA